MKKIIIFTSTSMTIESFLLPILNRLKKKYKIILVSNFTKKNSFYGHSIYDLKIHRKINILQDIKTLILFYKFIKREKCDLIFTVTPKAGLIGMICSYFNQVPKRIHIFTGQVWANKIFLIKFFLKIFDKIIFFLSTDILCDGKNQKFFLIEHGFNKSIKVLGNGSICGINTFKFRPDEKKKKLYRKKYKIKKGEIVFTYVGRIAKDKGIEVLKKNIIKLRSLNFKVRLFLVGKLEDGYRKTDFKKDNGFYLINHMKNVNKFFQFADIFITATNREGFGVSVAQAMSCGLPVIAPNIYGLKDLLKNNSNSYVYKLNDSKQLLFYSIELIRKKKKRESMGLLGRKVIIDNYQEKYVIKSYENFFHDLLK